MLRIHGELLCLSTLVLLAGSAALAQERAGLGLPQLVNANDRFGRKLLQQVHSRSPDKNVAVSPISLTIFLAAFQANSNVEKIDKQIGDAFGWGAYPRLSISTRMLLAAFEEPEPPARPRPNSMPAGGNLDSHFGAREAAWISNTFLYRIPEGVKQPIAPEFVHSAGKYFGMKFVNTGAASPTAADLKKARKSLGTLPQVSDPNDVWISSGTHLQTVWKGNTFSMSQPLQREFLLTSGQSKQVTMVTSELAAYPYAKTDAFEAVALPCNSGYMIVVLPTPGKNMLEVERDLAEHPEILDTALKPQIGDVTLPYFRIRFDSDLSEPLKNLGIKEVFEDLGSITNIPKSHLTQVSQKVDIEVNRDGIRANAETVAGMVYGGVLIAPKPFHLQLTRPFLFLIREQNTDALLFLGAVMDPSQN